MLHLGSTQVILPTYTFLCLRTKHTIVCVGVVLLVSCHRDPAVNNQQSPISEMRYNRLQRTDCCVSDAEAGESTHVVAKSHSTHRPMYPAIHICVICL